MADNCDRDLGSSPSGPQNSITSVFYSVEMPAANRPSPYPALGGSYYYPGEDFDTWRVQFEALRERHQWPDSVAKQYAFAYIRDSARDAAMDITSYGPESLFQLLNAYETRFQLLEDLVRLHLRREGLLHGSRRRRQPEGDEGASSNHGQSVVSWRRLHDRLPSGTRAVLCVLRPLTDNWKKSLYLPARMTSEGEP